MNPDTLRQQTESYLHDRIPISRAMGVAVGSCEIGGFLLTAPLEENHNHLGTAFGGSLGAVATLAGYALLWVRMAEPDCHIVIRESAIRYFHPVTAEIRARCLEPDPAAFAPFMTRFRETSRARLRLTVEIAEGDRTCVRFHGEFVAMKV
jgi:thioesterase domain-containing protein